MNRFDLNTEELINLLFDKDTTAVDRSMILQELQKRPESAKMLEQYRNLQSILDKTKVAPTPPPVDWTDSIMQMVKSISDKHFGFAWFGKLKYALFGLLILIPFSLYLFNFNFNEISKNNTVLPELSMKLDNQNNTNSNIEDVATNNIKQSNNPRASKQNNLKKPTLIKKSLIDKRNNDFQQNPNINRDYIDKLTINPNEQFFPPNKLDSFVLNDKRILPSPSRLNNHNKPNIVFDSPISPALSRINFDKLNIVVQARGNYAITSPEKNFPENDFIGKTYNLGIYFDVYENVYAGAEFGNEVFSQIFVANNQQTAVYDQSPTLFYFGLAGRYEFSQLSIGSFKPIGHLFVGGSSLGPLFRLNTVIQADISKTIGVFVGLEGGLLYYKNQNIWYNSSKLGIVGGINFKF